MNSNSPTDSSESQVSEADLQAIEGIETPTPSPVQPSSTLLETPTPPPVPSSKPPVSVSFEFPKHEKKTSNKALVAILFLVVIAAGVATGYFVWLAL